MVTRVEVDVVRRMPWRDDDKPWRISVILDDEPYGTAIRVETAQELFIRLDMAIKFAEKLNLDAKELQPKQEKSE